MKNIFLILFLLTVIYACDKNEILPAEQEVIREKAEGFEKATFTGVFSRNALGDERTSLVNLSIENNQFSGSGDEEKFPAICSGRFVISGNEIEFFNECIWTADFDWTLILGGKYIITTNGDEIILTQSRGGIIDTYRLKKQLNNF